MIVALIDDDEAVLDSLTALLRANGLAVRPFASAKAYLGDGASSEVACLVTDVRMPDVTGIELLHAQQERTADVPVILMTGHGDIEMAVACLKAGAFDFIEKPFPHERLIASIKSAFERQRASLNGRSERERLTSKLAELTSRQRQVMDLVVEGLSNKEIALRLSLSPRTVENYRAWVMEKMEARNLADLVRMVLRHQAD